MKGTRLLCAAGLFISGCSASLAGGRWSYSQTPIERVSVGDTMESVAEKLGNPQYVLPPRITDTGHKRTEWYYAIDRRSGTVLSSKIEPLSDSPVAVEGKSTMSSGSRTYGIIFQEGKVISVFERRP